jgi:hypothetical protein
VAVQPGLADEDSIFVRGVGHGEFPILYCLCVSVTGIPNFEICYDINIRGAFFRTQQIFQLFFILLSI